MLSLISLVLLQVMTEDRSVVLLSTNCDLFKSTNKSNSVRKSAPMMGLSILAIVKRHVKLRRNPRSNVRILSPYVCISLPLAAKSFSDEGRLKWSSREGGMTEMSAPVSTRKRFRDDLSVMYRRAMVTLLELTGSPGMFGSSSFSFLTLGCC